MQVIFIFIQIGILVVAAAAAIGDADTAIVGQKYHDESQHGVLVSLYGIQTLNGAPSATYFESIDSRRAFIETVVHLAGNDVTEDDVEIITITNRANFTWGADGVDVDYTLKYYPTVDTTQFIVRNLIVGVKSGHFTRELNGKLHSYGLQSSTASPMQAIAAPSLHLTMPTAYPTFMQTSPNLMEDFTYIFITLLSLAVIFVFCMVEKRIIQHHLIPCLYGREADEPVTPPSRGTGPLLEMVMTRNPMRDFAATPDEARDPELGAMREGEATGNNEEKSSSEESPMGSPERSLDISERTDEVYTPYQIRTANRSGSLDIIEPTNAPASSPVSTSAASSTTASSSSESSDVDDSVMNTPSHTTKDSMGGSPTDMDNEDASRGSPVSTKTDTSANTSIHNVTSPTKDTPTKEDAEEHPCIWQDRLSDTGSENA
jgi:hypothetical protein